MKVTIDISDDIYNLYKLNSDNAITISMAVYVLRLVMEEIERIKTMSKLVTIQTNVPICPECGGGLKINKISMTFQCYHCGSRFKVLNHGQTEREFVCEKNAGNNRQ